MIYICPKINYTKNTYSVGLDFQYFGPPYVDTIFGGAGKWSNCLFTIYLCDRVDEFLLLAKASFNIDAPWNNDIGKNL